MLELLTAPEAFAAPNLAHRYKVQLASLETELDSQGVAVPTASKIVDVLVIDASNITTLLNATRHLAGYQIVKYWTPEDCDCF